MPPSTTALSGQQPQHSAKGQRSGTVGVRSIPSGPTVGTARITVSLSGSSLSGVSGCGSRFFRGAGGSSAASRMIYPSRRRLSASHAMRSSPPRIVTVRFISRHLLSMSIKLLARLAGIFPLPHPIPLPPRWCKKRPALHRKSGPLPIYYI